MLDSRHISFPCIITIQLAPVYIDGSDRVDDRIRLETCNKAAHIASVGEVELRIIEQEVIIHE